MAIMRKGSDGLFYCPRCNESYDDYLRYCVACGIEIEPPPFGNNQDKFIDERDFDYTIHRNAEESKNR